MIRECVIEDLEQLQSISYQTFDETFREQNKKENIDNYLLHTFTKERLLKEFQNSNSFLYFIFYQKSLAGYLKLNIQDAQTEFIEGNNLEIERIYVLNQFQKLGLGKQLYDKSIEVAKELSCDHIWLGVWEKNYNAIAFYEKFKFEKIDEHAFYMGDEKQIDYIMIKHL